MYLDHAEITDIGLKRKKNEDSLGIKVPDGLAIPGALFIVADGMGGMGGGDVASRTAIDTVLDHYYQHATDTDTESRIASSLEAASAAIREAAAKQPTLMRMGSTACGLAVQASGEMVAFNIGDCRVYRVFNNESQIELLTHDQSITQMRIDSGMITEDEARRTRDPNVLSFLGQQGSAKANYRKLESDLGDVFILCSDGLWDGFEANGGRAELLSTMRGLSAEAAANKLVHTILQRGAPDNLSVIVVRLGQPPRKSWMRRLIES